LNSILPIEKNDILESFAKLEKLESKISTANLGEDNQAINLANWISGIPIIYYPWGLHAAAIRFKNSLQENAKTHAFLENVIESSHNGIMAWERPSTLQPILIEGKDDHIKTKERWVILREYFTQNNIPFKEIISSDGGILSKIICLIYLLDFSTIYYAIKLGVNPSPVKSIDFIKNRLDSKNP